MFGDTAGIITLRGQIWTGRCSTERDERAQCGSGREAAKQRTGSVYSTSSTLDAVPIVVFQYLYLLFLRHSARHQ